MKNKSKQLTEKQKIGNLGEEIAAKFLIGKGFKIIGRNYRQKWGEIDIIAKKEKIIHFIEVKTVSRSDQSVKCETFDHYEPEDNLHPWKIRRLYQTIESYLSEKDIDEDIDWQLDAVAVYLDQRQVVLDIQYLEDIF